MCEAVVSLLSLLRLFVCQLFGLHVSDVVFHFGLLLTQTSLGSPLDAWATKTAPLSQSVLLFFRSKVFSFIIEVKKKEMKV